MKELISGYIYFQKLVQKIETEISFLMLLNS
jgi:hypothetical protein